MSVPLLDLKAQYAKIREEVLEAVREVCESQWFILGPRVEELEERIAALCGVPYGCGVSSGTDALLACLMAEGIGPGDEVITTPYTFFATAGSIARTGARPVFVDIDPESFNIDPSRIEAAVTDRTRAVIPVHLFGQTADMEPIMEIARRYQLVVIEDAAQAIGAEYKDGRRAGGIGDYGCFSFFPSKNLGGFGEGGMVVCRDPDRIARLKRVRNHGMEPRYHHSMIGGNFRLDAIQAAVLLVKLKYLDEWTAKRQENARRYDAMFAASPASDHVEPPTVTSCAKRHVFNQYCIRLPEERRDAVWQGLKQRQIGCEVYYPIPMHLQECFSYLGYTQGAFPESERAARRSLALPVYPELTPGEQQEVVDAVCESLAEADATGAR